MTEHDIIRRRLRYRLILGKYHVVEIAKNLQGGNEIVLSIDDKQFLRISAPMPTDTRVGDLLTLYTEVLAPERQS